MKKLAKRSLLTKMNNGKIGIMAGLLIAVLLVAIPVKSIAEEVGQSSEKEAPEGLHGIELFWGNTHEDGEDGFSIGLSYEYHLTQMFGIGGLVEYVRGDFREWVIAVPFYLHPYKGWRFLVAPGVDIPKNDDDNEFLFRVGAAYEFEVDEIWSITPEFNVDFVDSSEVFVYGLSLGYKF